MGQTATSATALQVELAIAFDALPGLRDVTVFTGTEIAGGAGLFEVIPSPELVSVSPDAAATGDVLDDAQQEALTAYIQGGGGYVGIHAASDTEFDWPWYGKLAGAYFDRHPAIQPAVLDVIEDEGLRENARVAGERFQAGLRELAASHSIIGDVRGLGLFIGAELVRDPETLEPATAEASAVVNAMRERSILLSTDGPFDNVIKIKPPLVFTAEDADRVVSELDVVLSGEAFVDS